MPLPTDPVARKKLQFYTFMFEFFPDAWMAVVDAARGGTTQHDLGTLRWAREKSTDQMNAAFNHLFDYGLGQKKDIDGCWHLAKALWRQMAQLQLDIEADRATKAQGATNAAFNARTPSVELGQCRARADFKTRCALSDGHTGFHKCDSQYW